MLPILSISPMENIGFEWAVKTSDDELNLNYFVPGEAGWVPGCARWGVSHSTGNNTEFHIICLHKGCGPSETSYPVDEVKTQREAIRTTVPSRADRGQGRQAGQSARDPASCQRVGTQEETSAPPMAVCRHQREAPTGGATELCGLIGRGGGLVGCELRSPDRPSYLLYCGHLRTSAFEAHI